MKLKKILITGCAGFIGFHTTKIFLDKNYHVVGIDDLNKYYDTKLKSKRLKILKAYKNFKFYKININNRNQLKKVSKTKFEILIHLAAQAGVRYSISNPYEYFSTNLLGFCNILHLAKEQKTEKFIYASSSSIYGDKNSVPFKEDKSDTNNPIQLYAATKRSNEIIARSYYNLFKMSVIGLRFFTVYGEYGRPDMAIFKFTKNIINEKKINVFNYGKHFRDFTHVNDVAETVYKITKMKQGNKKTYQIFNVGSGKPIKLMKIIKYLEKYIGKKAKIKFLKKQPGDMKGTFAKNENLKKIIGFKQKVNIKEGLKNFVDWYKKNY